MPDLLNNHAYTPMSYHILFKNPFSECDRTVANFKLGRKCFECWWIGINTISEVAGGFVDRKRWRVTLVLNDVLRYALRVSNHGLQLRDPSCGKQVYVCFDHCFLPIFIPSQSFEIA